jgi:hypothetical protein
MQKPGKIAVPYTLIFTFLGSKLEDKIDNALAQLVGALGYKL